MHPRAPRLVRLRRAVAAAATLLIAASGVTLASTAAQAAELPTVVINEVESNGGTPADWVELKNVGSESVDVGGFIVKDNDDSRVKAIPADTVIAPGEYFVFVVDEAPDGFGLGSADSARLYLADGSTLVDETAWTAHATSTWGRCPDGSGDFGQTASTKGAANDCPAPEPSGASVVINEVESNGGTPGDWVELYNTDTENSVDLSGWRVLDNDGTHTAVPLADGTTIESGGYLLIEEAHLGFGLGVGDSVTLYDGPVDPENLVDTTTWGAHPATTWARCPNGTGDFRESTSSTKGTANDCSSPVRINEVESSGGSELDWIELVNTGSTAQAIGGMILKDSDDSRTFAIPADTSLAAGAFYAIDVDVSGGFGLGGADSARLYAADGTSLLDSYSWTAHATTTYGRCPDGTGEFATTLAATRGAANSCAGVVTVEAWPGGTTLSAVPTDVVFGGDASGLDYETGGSTDILWVVNNGTGVLSKLTPSGEAWNGASGWGAGKQLRYPGGTGTPDAEGVTVAAGGSAGGVFVATERNNDASGVSRPSILRFEVSGSDSTLTATNEWNLAADLATEAPSMGANAGLEGITWIPDAHLTAAGFVDESTGSAYDPADYPNHGSGVFFVALEATGDVYAYVLDLTGSTATRVATIATPGAMELDFEPETGLLWAVCDDSCEGRTASFEVGDTGSFEIVARYARPAAAANYANEGFAIAPQSACVSGLKPVYYADDNDTGGVSLRSGTIECTEVDGGDGGGGDGGDGGDGGAPEESELTPETEGGVTGPASAAQGAQITVQVGDEFAETEVDAWIFSTPTSLGSSTVSTAGAASFTIPASLTVGAHRIAVYDADGELIGWFAIEITAGALGLTGADGSGWLALAGVLLAAGAALVLGRLAVGRLAPTPARPRSRVPRSQPRRR